MARKTILETGYTFTPSTGTIVIPRVIPRERLILITNVTTNQVIYNFSDPNLRATTHTTSGTSNANTTTIVLVTSTTTMSSTDKLQIVVDEYDEKFSPSECYTDPVNKLRISQPQALIDTDFEYGTQITKWENLALINQRPFAFSSATTVANLSSITMSNRTVTVTTSASHGISVNTPISVQDTYLNIANGNFIVETVPNSSTFTYTARTTNTTAVSQLLDPNKTAIYTGTLYSSAQIGGTPSWSYSGNAITVTTTVPHGLAIGNEIAVTNVSASSNPPNGSWIIARIVSNTSFVFYSVNTPTGTLTGGQVYVRPQGQVLHRPFDGGVIFSSNANANFETQIRQTRRYFRYQSGKGIQVSSGTILRPNLQVDSITSSGTLVTVQTKESHNIQPGTVITVSGATPAAFNGTFTVDSITGFNSFRYTALSTPSPSIASGLPYVTVINWYGATNRLGIFDDQNGIFFEYDGQQLYAVRRNSTTQLSGKVSVVNGNNFVTQTSSAFPTYFSKQLVIGNFIVIRGQSYRVIDIASDTSLTISPSYRGATADYVISSLVQDTKIPQSQWNIDKCDGTGPSGFNIDLGRMQMFYIDYSWYGAGFVRWGFRGPDGNVLYCHKLTNSNVNTEAYMRSGNLPARYETQALPPTTQLTSTVFSGDSTISVASTTGFPPSGTLVIRDASVYEYVNYTGLGVNQFTGLTRGQAGGTISGQLTSGSNQLTSVSTGTAVQVGMRLIHSNIPDGTFIASFSGSTSAPGTITMTQAATSTIFPTITVPPMGSTASGFTYSATNPAAVELAYPTFGPTISHWGTSVIMDGRFDDDKSLVFTYGQSSPVTVPGSSSRALFSIRVSPSVDNGIAAVFGARELINRMQLTLRALDITTSTTNANLLVRAYLNAVPSAATTWTNAVGNVAGAVNSSLAQIADHPSGSNVTVSGGEVTAGFFVGSGANSIDLSSVRDLGNSILGGGGTTSNSQIYPDGPDTLTIVVTNLSTTTAATVFGRLSWTEAQA